MQASDTVKWDDVLKDEDAALATRLCMKDASLPYRTGLALSGGGVRSASFSLGVLQVLADRGLLKHFDYLSTVSGGGYIGSALALRLAKAAEEKSPDPDKAFPYGKPDCDSPELAHIRHHGNYLAPSGFGSLATGFYIVARSILLNLFIWIMIGAAFLASAMLMSDYAAGVHDVASGTGGRDHLWLWDPARETWLYFILPPLGSPPDLSFWRPGEGGTFFLAMLAIGLGLLAIVAAMAVGVSLSSWWVRSDTHQRFLLLLLSIGLPALLALAWALDVLPHPGLGGLTGADAVQATLPALVLLALIAPALSMGGQRALGKDREISVKYARRRVQERWAGTLLTIAAAFLAVGAIPYVSDWIVARSVGDAAAPRPDPAGQIPLHLYLVYLGSAGAALYGFYQGHIRGKLGAGSATVVIAGSILLVFGAVLIAHRIALDIIGAGWVWDWILQEDNPAVDGRTLVLVGVIGAFALAIFVNVNDMGLSRFYRDRLMEAFMPDLHAGEPLTGPATEADGFLLARIARPKQKEREALPLLKPIMDQIREKREAPPAAAPVPLLGPYLLVNTYLLARRYRGDRGGGRPSLTARIRRRRGDSFVLTPRRVGSTLTGWRATRDVLDNQLTLPTAMAISGAAVNPGSGIAGQGPTANAATAIAMSLLSLRLGYRFRWNGGGWLGGFGRWMNPFGNHFVPGLSEILAETFSRPSTEGPTFIELSDGGHFDNLGLYELIRRRCGLILVCDGGEDSTGAYESFTSLMTLAREDFGAVFRLDCALAGKPSGPAQLVARPRQDEYPKAAEYAERGFFLATIHYDDAKDAPGGGEGLLEDRTTEGPAVGLVIYLKATMLAELGLPSRGYKGVNPAFPSEPTTDQFFSPEQFNAYVDVGNRVARQMLEATDLKRRLGRDPARRPDLGALLAAFAPPGAEE